LTLRFIGDVQGADPQRIGEVLESVRMAPFELTLKGVGHFPPRGQPKILWVGVADEAPVVELHRKIERTLVRTGLEPEGRKFSPHVTLGRLRNPSAPHVAAFLAQHSLFVGDAFAVDRFALYSSVLAPGGSKYRVEQIITLDRD
jgi:2'-5' RNA ligase